MPSLVLNGEKMLALKIAMGLFVIVWSGCQALLERIALQALRDEYQ